MTARAAMFIAALSCATLSSAFAEDPPADSKAPSKASSSAGTGARQKKVLRLEEFTVEGRIQKPQAFFILQRGTITFDGGDKKESFLPKIQKSCEKDPF